MVNIIQVMARGKPSVLTTRFTNMAVLEVSRCEFSAIEIPYNFVFVVSPTMNHSTKEALSARNAFGGRRYTEVNPSIVAGIKMREQ